MGDEEIKLVAKAAAREAIQQVWGQIEKELKKPQEFKTSSLSPSPPPPEFIKTNIPAGVTCGDSFGVDSKGNAWESRPGILASAAIMFDKNGSPWPDYEQMVKNLFKQHPSQAVRAHHASTGIAGESGELRASTSRKNCLEELGDMRFYVVSLSQQLGQKPGQGVWDGGGEGDNLRQLAEVSGSPYRTPTHATVMDHIHIISCELLDLTKKAWIYEDPKRLNELKIWCQLELLQINLNYYVQEVIGSTWEEIEFGNQMKLLGTAEQKGRYADGNYSNEAALARADKEVK